MKKVKLLWRIITATGTDRIITTFLVFMLIAAWPLALIEPGIGGYGDALWYCFSIITTIGFGDMTAVTVPGRILSVLVGLFGILTVGIVIGVVVAYYNEFARMRHDESLEVFADRLEHLPDLSPDELAEISAKVRASRLHGGRGKMAGR